MTTLIDQPLLLAEYTLASGVKLRAMLQQAFPETEPVVVHYANEHCITATAYETLIKTDSVSAITTLVQHVSDVRDVFAGEPEMISPLDAIAADLDPANPDGFADRLLRTLDRIALALGTGDEGTCSGESEPVRTESSTTRRWR